MEITGRTDRGLQRDANEDGLLCLPSEGLAVVADGMGGSSWTGRFAPFVVTAALRGALRTAARDLPDDAAAGEAALRDAFARAHEALVAAVEALGRVALGTGAAAVAAWAHGTRVYVGHVGDARCYRLRDGALVALTRDHSLLNEIRAMPDVTDEMLAQAKQYTNVITRALGFGEAPKPAADVVVDAPRAGDVYLLCSDGLWRVADDATIAATIAGAASLDDAARALVERANLGGGPDNVAVALMRWAPPSRAPAPAPRRATAPTPAECAAIARGALRPDRARLAATRSVVRPHDDPRAAWEALAAGGWIPLDWVDAPGRAFLGAPETLRVERDEALAGTVASLREGRLIVAVRYAWEGSRMLVELVWRAILPHPASAGDAALLASDPAGLMAAEQLADEAAARLRPWGLAAGSRSLWAVAPPSDLSLFSGALGWTGGADDALLDALSEPDRTGDLTRAIAEAGRDAAVARWLTRLASGAALWAGADDGPVPRWNVALPHHPWADLPSPFAPMLALAARGYALAALSDAGRVLVAPPP